MQRACVAVSPPLASTVPPSPPACACAPQIPWGKGCKRAPLAVEAARVLTVARACHLEQAEDARSVFMEQLKEFNQKYDVQIARWVQ